MVRRGSTPMRGGVPGLFDSALAVVDSLAHSPQRSFIIIFMVAFAIRALILTQIPSRRIHPNNPDSQDQVVATDARGAGAREGTGAGIGGNNGAAGRAACRTAAQKILSFCE